MSVTVFDPLRVNGPEFELRHLPVDATVRRHPPVSCT